MPSERWKHERRKNDLIDRPLPLQADNSGRQRQFHLLWWQAQRLISSEEGLATPGHAENQRVRDLSVMQVQEYGVLLSVSSAARYSVPRCAFVFSPGRIARGSPR